MITSRARSPVGPSRSQSSSFLWTFSTMMIAASTIAPIAIAMPPSDMMFAVRCCAAIGMNASSTAIGSVRIGISALRTCSRKTKMTSADDDHLLDQRVPQRVRSTRSISSERS